MALNQGDKSRLDLAGADLPLDFKQALHVVVALGIVELVGQPQLLLDKAQRYALDILRQGFRPD